MEGVFVKKLQLHNQSNEDICTQLSFAQNSYTFSYTFSDMITEWSCFCLALLCLE